METELVTLCQMDGLTATLTSYFVLFPFVVFIGVAVVHALVLDLTSLLLNFYALWLTWGLLTVQAATAGVARPNADVCPTPSVLGSHARPDPQGTAVTVFAFMWLFVCLRNKLWKRMAWICVYLMGGTVLFWVGAYLNGYVSGVDVAVGVGEALFFAVLWDLVFQNILVPIIERSTVAIPWIGARNILLPHVVAHADEDEPKTAKRLTKARVVYNIKRF